MPSYVLRESYDLLTCTAGDSLYCPSSSVTGYIEGLLIVSRNFNANHHSFPFDPFHIIADQDMLKVRLLGYHISSVSGSSAPAPTNS